MTGYSVRQRRLYVVRLQQQAASSAVADERLRIARELHDVVAHSMSVIAVQAGYGQYVIDDSPDGAREALGAIQVTSREALDEMRRMLGVLRQQDVTPAQGQADAWRRRRRGDPGPRSARPDGRLRGRSRTADAVAASGDGALADAAPALATRPGGGRRRAGLRPRRFGAARAGPGSGQPRPAHQAHLQRRGPGEPGGVRAMPARCPRASTCRPTGSFRRRSPTWSSTRGAAPAARSTSATTRACSPSG